MIMNFASFVNEGKKSRPGGHPYFRGLSKSTVAAKKKQMKKQATMDDSDPSAYKPMPGDKVSKTKLKKSKHTSKYEEMYGS